MWDVDQRKRESCKAECIRHVSPGPLDFEQESSVRCHYLEVVDESAKVDLSNRHVYLALWMTCKITHDPPLHNDYGNNPRYHPT